jgi:ribose 5-phosphate isomerase B
MRIALGCDHRGLTLKQAIMSFLNQSGYEYHDFGCYSPESVDYPDFARPVAEAVVSGKFDYGILICATGIGMSIAANKVKGIRAALCCGVLDAQRSREHNDANVLCLAGEKAEINLALDTVKVFLSATFESGRHLRRLEKVRAIEAKYLDNA